MNSIPQKEQLTGTLNKVSVILDNVNRMRGMLDNKLATRFSVFQVFGGLGETEMSKILAHLLNPNETHAQGDKFLRLFLQMLSKNYGTMQDVSSTNICPLNKVLDSSELLAKAIVKTEDLTDANRRIDVTLQIGEVTIGIENKLWAAEQENQLADYWMSLTKNNENNHARAVLIFLCVDKNRRPESMKKNQLDELIAKGNFFQINYEDDIIPWLKECVKVTESEKIRWYLEEVINWINKYCYWRDDFMSEKSILLDIADENESVLNAMLYIQHNLDAVKLELIKEYLGYIKEQLRAKLENSDWEFVPVKGSEAKAWYEPIAIGCAGVHAGIQFRGGNYVSPYYGIWAPKKEVVFYDALRDALDKHNYGGKKFCSDAWPIYVDFEKENWMLQSFITRLYNFHKNHKDSDLGKSADTVVENLLCMMKIVDDVLKSQKPNFL